MQMIDWILHNRRLFLQKYTEIGRNLDDARRLQEDHSQFTLSCMVSLAGQFSTQVSRNVITSVFVLCAERLRQHKSDSDRCVEVSRHWSLRCSPHRTSCRSTWPGVEGICGRVGWADSHAESLNILPSKRLSGKVTLVDFSPLCVLFKFVPGFNLFLSCLQQLNFSWPFHEWGPNTFCPGDVY